MNTVEVIQNLVSRLKELDPYSNCSKDVIQQAESCIESLNKSFEERKTELDWEAKNYAENNQGKYTSDYANLYQAVQFGIQLGSTCRNPTKEEIKKIRDDFTKAVADAFNIPLNMVK